MILEPTDANIAACADILRYGGVVGMPTETVYGLAASVLSDGGLERIYQLKGRPADNPLIVHVESIDQAATLTDEGHAEVLRRVASAFWPGPLTCVVPAAAHVSRRVTAGLGTVAVRMPRHPVALALIASLQCPVAAPSANRSGRPSPTTALHVIADLGSEISVLDGGSCEVGLESTVVRITSDRCTILRPGSVSRRELANAIQLSIDVAGTEHDLRASPGTRYRHYAPESPVVLCSTLQHLRAHALEYNRPFMVLSVEPVADLPEHAVQRTLGEATLYAELRHADDLQLAAILVLCDNAVRGREALINRLERAASASEGRQ